MVLRQLLIVHVSLSATWRSTIRTAVCRWRCGTGTWPAATTSWDRCPLASRSSRNWEWMDGEMRGGGAAQVEEEVEEWRWPCSLLRCRRYTSVGVLLLFNLGDTRFWRISSLSLYLCFLISPPPPPPPLSSSVSVSLYLLFLLMLPCLGF